MTGKSLANYFQLLFLLVHKYKWNVQDVENLPPFERDIYVDMIIADEKKIKK